MSLEVPTAASPAGYRQDLRRDFSRWTNLAIGFAFVSPVVGLYAIFPAAREAGGGGWWQTLVIALAGQILVALVFAELAAQFPLAGGVYQWSRRLVSPAYAWFAGWVYVWALIAILSATAFGAASYLSQVLWDGTGGSARLTILAVLILAICSILNVLGGTVLRLSVVTGVAATLIGSLGVAVLLVATARHPSLAPAVQPSWNIAWPSFSAALAFAGWAFIGFDACGSVAEETRDAARVVPRMIVTALASVGGVVLIAAFLFTLAVPRSAGASDPILGSLTRAVGPAVARPILAVAVVAFLACCIAVQTTVSRMIYSFARDGMLPGSTYLRRVSTTRTTPATAVAVTGVLAAIFVLWSGALTILVLFSTSGLYAAFTLTVVAALAGRLAGRWQPHAPFSTGRLSLPITIVAVAWVAFETINLAWPRAVSVPWYERDASIVCGSILLALGLVYFVLARPDRKLGAAGTSAVRYA